MAYAEKRGKGPTPWRVKYKLPSGIETSESGFETKAAALTWGRDQEARIREGRWTDPNAGKTHGRRVDRPLARHAGRRHQHGGPPRLPDPPLHPPTLGRSAAALAQHRGDHPLGERPARPDRRLPADGPSRPQPCSCTILGDAATTKPPLIPYNPALRPRNRGRRTGRRLQPQPAAGLGHPAGGLLLVAERAALLTGRDEDFTMIVTIGYTGLRWGEAIGLERDYRPPRRDPRRVAAPRDQRHASTGSHRRTTPTAARPGSRVCPVDLPPFLTGLLTRQIQDHPHPPCACAAQHGGSGQYVFLGPDGGHYRRSNYARRVFRPACDGRTTKPQQAAPSSSSPTPPPGPAYPIAAWPPAQTRQRDYTPPHGRGIQAIPDRHTPRLLASRSSRA